MAPEAFAERSSLLLCFHSPVTHPSAVDKFSSRRSAPAHSRSSTQRNLAPSPSSLRLQRRQPQLRFFAVLVQLQRTLVLCPCASFISALLQRYRQPVVIVPNLRVHHSRLLQVRLR